MTSYRVLTLPGWQNSGPDHWQSRWEHLHGYTRVQQHDWMRPLRGDWMIQLEEAILASPGPVVLAAHSLGCLLTAAWAAHSQNTHRVAGALLVAPGDMEREEFRPVLKSWAPIALQRLPFRSMLLGSTDDPYCSLDRARTFASAWGAEFVDYGARGHINAESGLGDWPEGHALLLALAAAQSASASASASTATGTTVGIGITTVTAASAATETASPLRTATGGAPGPALVARPDL